MLLPFFSSFDYIANQALKVAMVGQFTKSLRSQATTAPSIILEDSQMCLIFVG